MNPPHPLAESLRQHLLKWRGHWINKLTPELKQALEQFPDPDIRRSATLLLHGYPDCSNQKYTKIAEGWKFCHTNGRCECFIKHFHEKSEATNIAKRGVKNAAQSEEVKQKIKETCLERYGVESTGAIEDRKQKVKQTNLEKYGVENVFAAKEIRARIHDTVLEKYGVDHISQSSEHQKKMQQTIVEKYGVDNIAHLPEIIAQIKETNLERYGGVAPACSETVQAKIKETIEEKYGDHPSRLHISPENRLYDVDDLSRYAGQKARAIASQTGYDQTTIYKMANRWNISLDHTRTGTYREAENIFADQLSAILDTFERNRFILNQPDSNRKWQIDFYFPDKNLGIEFGAAYWHSEANGKAPDYHAKKLQAANNQGIDLLQIFYDEWIDHPEAVMATIKHKLGLNSIKVYARKCSLAQVSYDDAKAFYDRYHVFGGVGATVHLGLIHDGEMVACMSFTKQKHEWVLVRYASKNHVVGGASRLLKAFEKTYEWETITSFVDLRWSKGDLYNVLGFTVDKHLPPDYAYVVGYGRIHKFNLRKNARRFEKYCGSGMTERQMAMLEGIPRVYDAGKLRVIKRRE